MKKIKVCLLLRVSLERQNLARQREELNEVCERNDWKVTHVIEEKGSGAKKNKDREAIQELQKLYKNRKVSKVLVHEISRLGRTTAESLTLVDEMTELGISVYEHERNIETLNPDGSLNPISEMILSVMASMYKMERSTMIARIKSGMKSAARRGVHCGRPVGSAETPEKTLKKYPALVNSFKNKESLSLRKRAKLYEVSVNTVRKIQTCLLEIDFG